MESKDTSPQTPKEPLEQKGPRQVFLHFINALFGKPYLPFGLIFFFGAIALTQFAYILMNQPLTYWLDHSQGLSDSLPIFGFGPIVALGFYLVYIALMGVILSFLNRSPALVLWCAAVCAHLITFTRISPACGSGAFKIFPTPLCSIYQYGVSVVIGLIMGIALIRNLFKGEVNSSSAAGQGWLRTRLGLSGLSLSLTGVWLLLMAIGVIYSARIPVTGWQPVRTAHFPSPRYEMMVAYDSGRSKAVLFGGAIETNAGNWVKTAETWEWNGDDWTQIQTEKSPPARSRGAMAYDRKRSEVILFGGWDDLGKSMNDTWEWDGKTWKEVCSFCNPPPRGCFDMFYDTRQEQVVLYGGCDENGAFYNDAWGWNGEDWDPIKQKDSPLLSGAPLIYDPQNHRAVGFLAGFPTGTWIWDDNGWSKLNSPTEPPERAGAEMDVDPTTGQILMFGGQKDSGKTLFNDTWGLKGRTWSQLTSGILPPGRWGDVVFFDPIKGKFMLFGGYGKGILNDMWEFTLPASK